MAGLPGAGKTAIARVLATRLQAVHIRIDTIEQALLSSGTLNRPLGEVGYIVGYRLAEDQLRLGLGVVADSVNPLEITRDAWLAVPARASVRAIEVEVTCSDPVEHRRRLETREADIPGLQLPTWDEVVARTYEPWSREHIVIDTGGRTIGRCVEQLLDRTREDAP
jgi:predicted kinase